MLSKYIGERFSVSATQIAVVQGTLVERLVKKFGEKTMTIASLLGLGSGVLFVFLAPAFGWLYPISLLRDGLGGLFWATMGALTASKVQPREQGKLAGVNTALQSPMAVFGPLAAGIVYDTIAPGAPLWMGALLFALAALLVLGVKVRQQPQLVSLYK